MMASIKAYEQTATAAGVGGDRGATSSRDAASHAPLQTTPKAAAAAARGTTAPTNTYPP